MPSRIPTGEAPAVRPAYLVRSPGELFAKLKTTAERRAMIMDESF